MSGGVLFLAANTPRSQAYAQVMSARGIAVARAILYDRPGAVQPGKADLPARPNISTPVPLADPLIPLTQSLAELTDDIRRVEAESVNDQAMLEAVRGAAAEGFEFVIYSGYGGQVISKAILDAGLPFLHAHSGWLPQYRGSTTIFYSLLAGMGCGVSVINTAPEIDQGPILARRQYPAPRKGVDIDYFYDPAIRADIMAEVVIEWQSRGRPEEIPPDGEPANYYVVHPVLKHLALLGLEGDDAD